MKTSARSADSPSITRLKMAGATRYSLLLLFGLIFLAGMAGSTARATQTNSMTLTIDASDPGPAIPDDFIGVSVSSFNIDDDEGYTRYFQTSNTQMVNLFQQIGIKHMRTIMGKATPGDPDPSFPDIDAFFDFAAAAGVEKIIWSLHLFNAEAVTNWSNNEAIASHIWTTTTTNGVVEKDLLDTFAFDNEPDWIHYICCNDPNITGYFTPLSTGGYRGMWNLWQQDIADLAPGAQFSGPDTGSKWPCPGEVDTSPTNNVPFTLQFARDESSVIPFASQHLYAGGGAGTNTALELAEICLSSNMITTNYTIIQNDIVSNSPVLYRLTECSAFDDDANTNNQIFATALWGLDCFHWFARHGWLGVDPFTRCAQWNSPIYLNGGNYVAEPYAYAMKAFNLVSGNVIYTSKFQVSNPGEINVTAYGVVNSTNLYVTIINKTFNTVGSRAANVSIPAPTAGFTVKHAKYIVLSGGSTAGSSGNATLFGACLGGAEIPNDGSSWAGTWTSLSVTNGGTSVLVQPTTAVIVELQNY